MTEGAENGYEPKSRWWLNLPPLLFDTYQDLVRAYADTDTRAIYIITFTEMLSLALPRDIEDYPEYAAASESYPLSRDDPLKTIPFNHYGGWLRALRAIMRMTGIIGGEKTFSDESDEIALIFDDLEAL